jgi:hypothetical protein
MQLQQLAHIKHRMAAAQVMDTWRSSITVERGNGGHILVAMAEITVME